MSKIAIQGDIHGIWYNLATGIATAVDHGAEALIQVGDFGLMSWRMKHASTAVLYGCLDQSPIPVYFIEGNHDDCTYWQQQGSDIIQVYKNLFFIPRGVVHQFGGMTMAFLGGAASIDKNYRLKNKYHWDSKEEVTQEQAATLLANVQQHGNIDVFISHTPPESVVQRHFNPLDKLQFGVGVDWSDPSAQIVEDTWNALGNPLNISGHMHQSVYGVNYQILGINEVTILDSSTFRKE